jgi:Tol biopolymer transport system component
MLMGETLTADAATSPGLHAVYLQHAPSGGFGDLFVAPTAGGTAKKLATGEIVVPRWSPDGTRIAYNDGSGAVYVVDVQSGEQTMVINTEHLPTWVDDNTLSLSP